MNFNVWNVVEHMGVFDRAILMVLVLMALVSLVLFFERLLAFERSRTRNRRFAAEATAPLTRGQYEQVVSLADAAQGSHLARLLGAGTRAFLKQRALPPGHLSPVETVRRELERKVESMHADLRRGLSVLATVGSVAPFVGLLGTVMGIINSFQSMAKEGSGGLGTVSAGISEALLVTAAGLVVAIPAVLAFNLLSGKSDKLELALEQAKGEFLDLLEYRHGTGRQELQAPELPASPRANGREPHVALD